MTEFSRAFMLYEHLVFTIHHCHYLIFLSLMIDKRPEYDRTITIIMIGEISYHFFILSHFLIILSFYHAIHVILSDINTCSCWFVDHLTIWNHYLSRFIDLGLVIVRFVVFVSSIAYHLSDWTLDLMHLNDVNERSLLRSMTCSVEHYDPRATHRITAKWTQFTKTSIVAK